MTKHLHEITNLLERQKTSLKIDVLPQGELLQTLLCVQESSGFIPKECIPVMADAFNISRADVYGVIGFYDDLKLRDAAPMHRITVRVCQAEACQSMGCRELTTQLKKQYPENNSDVRIENVYCLGNCALAPSIMIGQKCYGRVSYRRAKEILKTAKN